jgi:hypothetical protein
MHKKIFILFLLITMALPSVYSIVQKQIKAMYCLVADDDDEDVNDLDDKAEKKLEADKYIVASHVFVRQEISGSKISVKKSAVTFYIQQCYLEVQCPPPNAA